MSEFTNKQAARVEQLTKYTVGLIEGESGKNLLEVYQILETTFLPSDVLPVFDQLFNEGYGIEDIKSASNKLFNILFKNLTAYEQYQYKKDSILHFLTADNAAIKSQLKHTKEKNKQVNREATQEIIQGLIADFQEIAKTVQHYVVMQNIVFPEIEKQWEQHQCLKVLWSFHDEINDNIQKTLAVLSAEAFDLEAYNKFSSKVYFNVNTVMFREEYVLFPILSESFSEEVFSRMRMQLQDIKLPFADTSSIKAEDKSTFSSKGNGLVKLSTGELSIEQLELIFHHLPIDMTYVDEHDEVRFFSDPKHRIFPRTVGIIGRKVQKCHPHESVNVVEDIVKAFRNGEKDEAAFWISMGPKFVLIKYFAVRNKQGEYKGVLEVSQEISDIKKLEGERRLLDW